jgi:hypothetical protein
MKTCTCCFLEKPEAAFSFKNRTKGTRQAKCKDCAAAYTTLWHRRSKIECSNCGEAKYRHDFAFKSKRAGRKQSVCKLCINLLRNAAYAALPLEERRKQAKAKKSRLKLTIPQRKQLLLNYLKAHPCVDCGETDPAVLEFDHVRGEKVATVYTLAVHHCRQWEVVEAEIAKCDIRCVNCHRRKTATEQNWYKK